MDRGRNRRRRTVIVAIVVLVAFVGVAVIGALGSVSAPSPTVPPGPSPTASAGSGPKAAEAFLPVYADPFTAASAEAESTRVVDLMVRFVDSATTEQSNVTSVDVAGQVVPATDAAPAYFGALRTLTLTPGVDAAAQTDSLRSALEAGGWTVRDSTTDASRSLFALSSDPDPSRAWFLVIDSDTPTDGPPIVGLKLGSPPLP